MAAEQLEPIGFVDNITAALVKDGHWYIDGRLPSGPCLPVIFELVVYQDEDQEPVTFGIILRSLVHTHLVVKRSMTVEESPGQVVLDVLEEWSMNYPVYGVVEALKGVYFLSGGQTLVPYGSFLHSVEEGVGILEVVDVRAGGILARPVHGTAIPGTLFVPERDIGFETSIGVQAGYPLRASTHGILVAQRSRIWLSHLGADYRFGIGLGALQELDGARWWSATLEHQLRWTAGAWELRPSASLGFLMTMDGVEARYLWLATDVETWWKLFPRLGIALTAGVEAGLPLVDGDRGISAIHGGLSVGFSW